MVKDRPVDPKAIFMNSTLVTKIDKNQLEEIRMCILKNNKIDVRTYFYFPRETEPKPTKKGIWLSFKHIPPILSALDKISRSPDQEFDIQIDSTDKDQIRVYTNEYLKNRLVHIRTFYLKDNEFKPGKGVSFSMALVVKIIEGLKKVDSMKDATEPPAPAPQ